MPSCHRDLPFEVRQAEASSIKRRYPNRIPVICERYPRTNLPILDKKKYLVPCNMMIGEFKYIIHKHLCMASTMHGSASSFDKTVYLFAGGRVPKAGAIMQDVYEELKDTDGFLYMQYSAENTLG